MRTLYYVVEKVVDDWEGLNLTGEKYVTVYEISNNSPVALFNLDLDLEDNTEDKIEDYLLKEGFQSDGNGLGLIQL